MTASAYGRLTPRMAWQLAAPHTWPAAILPVLVAAAAAAVTSFSISATMVCVLLVICVLMQSAVNTFNDYYDYVKGADSADDNVDPTDAVLVYNNVNPRAALALAVGFLAAAFLLGAYVIWIAGWIDLRQGGHRADRGLRRLRLRHQGRAHHRDDIRQKRQSHHREIRRHDRRADAEAGAEGARQGRRRLGRGRFRHCTGLPRVCPAG